MTVERQPFSAKVNLVETIGVSALSLSAVAAFLAGRLLGEDSIGGARFDFLVFHWPAIVRFSTVPWSTAITENYPVSNNPLLYIITSLLPIHEDMRVYHAITCLIALLTWPLLSWAYYRRYNKYGTNWLWALFAGSAVLLSPSFRSSAFWGTTDYLPITFCAGTSLLLSRFQDYEGREGRALGPSTLAALAVVSACAFYTRQFYAFLPVFAAWTVITRTKTSPLLVLSIFVLTAVPEMFLLYIWRGVNGPGYHADFHPTLATIVLVGSNIGFLSIPLIAGCIRGSLHDVLPQWWSARSTAVATIGLALFIAALSATEWPEPGGGIIEKGALKMGAFGTPLILAVSYFGIAAAILFSTRSATNALLASTFIVALCATRFPYQHYVEPALYVSVFLFADTQTAKAVFNKRVLVWNFAFAALILTIGIIYYGGRLAP